MLRCLVGLLLLSSCSLGVIKKGGEKPYAYNIEHAYTIEELKTIAPQVISTSSRDPEKGKLEELFSNKQPPLKRIGILVFETNIQPTRSGMAEEDLVYLTAQGKQILTENFLTIWEQSLPILGDKLEFVESSEFRDSKNFLKYGLNVTDHVISKRETLASDDVLFLEKGKTTTNATIMNPRGMRDLSLALVPANELMGGPKYSEHAKHAVNDVARELNLDAVIIVMSKINWSKVSSLATIELESSVLVPLSSYHTRLKNLGQKRDLPNTTISYRHYSGKLSVPVEISSDEDDRNFDAVERDLLTPVLNTYNDLTHMLQVQMIKDLNKTLK